MKPENLSHRALMMLINAKCDYIISRITALDYIVANGTDGNSKVLGYVEQAKAKFEKDVKNIVAKDKTKGGWDA